MRGSDNSLPPEVRALLDLGPLPPQEEHELIERWRHKDPEAGETLLKRNYRLILWLAARGGGRTFSLNERVQAGAVGAFRALRRFDPDKGRLKDYLIHWIRKELGELRPQAQTIHVPRYIARRLSVPSSDEVEARIHGWRAPEERLDDPLSRGLLLLHRSSRGRESFGLEDLPSPDEHVGRSLERQDEAMAVRHALADLPLRWQEIITRRFGLDGEPAHTLQEIGDTLGITRERVRQLEALALNQLRLRLRTEEVPPPPHTMAGGLAPQ
jgi:RNA polymerase sigma factor (sigma-70 family)